MSELKAATRAKGSGDGNNGLPPPDVATGAEGKSLSIERRVNLAIKSGISHRMIADAASATRARSWMMRLAKGSTVDLRTNLFLKGGKGRDRVWIPYSEIRDEWGKRLSAIYQNLPSGLRDLLTQELEQPNAEKMGPKSMFLGYFQDGPNKLRAVFSDKVASPKIDRRALDRARDRLVALIPSGSIHLTSIDEAVRYERGAGDVHNIDAPGLDPTTNSGPPFFLGRWKPHPDMAPQRREYTAYVFGWLVDSAKAKYEELRNGRDVRFDAMVAQRTVSRGPQPLRDPKTKRLVIAMSKDEAILWKMFTPQTQEILRHATINGVNIFNAWCDAPVIDDNQQRILTLAEQYGLIPLSGDVSSFDASVVPSIWEFMAEGLASWFYKSAKFFLSLNRSVIYHTRVLSPGGVIQDIPSSIKSGSGGTNFIDCMYNLLTMFYGEELGLYKIIACEVQGDDFVILGHGVNPDSISEAYSHLNLTVHPDKQMYVKGALGYLQRVHVKGYWGGIASTMRVLNSILVQEKTKFAAKDWNPYTEAIQAIAKLENAYFNPAFEGLVQYVAEHDKYGLGRGLSAEEVIKQAGKVAGEVLQISPSSFSLNVLDKDASAFARSPTNGVLRGEVLPPPRAKERFLRVYSSDRLSLIDKYSH